MKKILSLIMCAFISVSFTGCNKNVAKETKVDIKKDPIQEKIDSMSIVDKLNQMMFISLDQVYEKGNFQNFTKVTEPTEKFLERNKVGGIILFKNNMKDTIQTTSLTSELQKSISGNKLFIGVDEEGGRVSKIPTSKKIGTARSIGNTGNKKNAFSAGKTIGTELKTLGLNLDFAPVMDVDTNPKNPVIGDRAFSRDEKVVGDFGVEFINGLREEGVLSTAKHFPGHGDTEGDSHVDLVKVSHTLDRLEKVELYPFNKAIEANVDMIMVGHIIVPTIDDDKTPATLSSKIMTDLLKEKMGFSGVVITDAFNMGAIAKNFDINTAIEKSINAGADMILMPVGIVPGAKEKDYDNLIEHLRARVQSGDIKEERINDALRRILKAKEKI